MRIKHTTLSLLLLITIILTNIFTAVVADNQSSQAAENEAINLLSNGVFSYYIYNNSAVIEKCLDQTSNIIIIPDRIDKYKVTQIKDGAFSLCSNLKGFVSQNNLFTVINGILYNKDTLLCYPPAKARKTFIIPPNVTKIAACAFFGNSTLEYISIPGTVHTINNETFADCDSLKNVVLHEGTQVVSDGAFAFCSSLNSIVLPKSINHIGDAAFYECHSLKSINLSDSVTQIGKMAFQECSSMTEIYIPSLVTNLSDWLFSIGESLESVKISPENADYIENNGIIYTKNSEKLVFCPQNIKLKNVNVQNGVNTIGEYAFSENNNIEHVTLSDSVEKIENGAFYQAKKLENLSITNSLSEIGEYSFFGCKELGKTTLYTNVEKIGNGAFEQCDNLTLLAAKGSTAYFYSKQNNVEFEIDGSQPEVEIEKWSQGYIDWAENNGITSEISDYTAKLNYEGLCWLLINLYESVKIPVEITVENPFSDTASPAVIKAYQLGIIEKKADSDVFDGQRNVSRQVICMEIYRLLKLINGNPPKSGEKNDFRDSSDIADWAYDYVNTAYNNGIINGLPDGRINPNGNASIEDALGMLYNASLLIEK